MCRVLGVSRAGFYAWERRAPCDRALTDAWLTEKVKRIHAASDGTYGSRRIHAELAIEHEIRVGSKRVERLMRAAGISREAKRPVRRTTVRMPGVRVAPDLLERDFNPTGPDRSWAADITYIRTWEGWLYLAHVQDLFSRRIIGWAMADHLRAELVIEALQMAIERRGRATGSYIIPTMDLNLGTLATAAVACWLAGSDHPEGNRVRPGRGEHRRSAPAPDGSMPSGPPTV